METEQPKRKSQQGVAPLRAASGARVNADVRIDDDDNPGVTLTGW